MRVPITFDAELDPSTGHISCIQPALLQGSLQSITTRVTADQLNASSFQGKPVVLIPGVPGYIIVVVYMIHRMHGGSEPGQLLPNNLASGFVNYSLLHEASAGIGQTGVDYTPITFAGSDADNTSPQLISEPFGAGITDWSPPPNTDPAFIGDSFCMWMPADTGYQDGNWFSDVTCLYVLNKV